MKKALILHAWYSKPENNWYFWLRDKLQKKGYKVLVPDLPTMRTNMPNMKKQLKYIKDLKFVDKDTVVIGHSLGCLLAMRLAEKQKYKTMVLVVGWDFNDLCEGHKLFWKNPINHKKIKEHVKSIYCISSDNDLYFTAVQYEDISKRLGGKLIMVKGAGHFNTESGIKEIPQLLELL